MYTDNDNGTRSEQGGLSQSLASQPYKDQPTAEDDDLGSDTSSTSSSSSSTAERKRAAAAATARMHHQEQYEQDELSDDDGEVEDAGEARGLLSNMDHPEREVAAGFSGSQVAKKRQKRRRIVAGVAGGMAGLVMLGPATAVAAGVAGAMLFKRMDRKKKEEALKQKDNGQNELASLISPKAQI